MSSVDDYISRATESLNKDDIAAAIQMYREALKLDPNDPTALTGLGAALDEAGELESATECYKKALKADSDDVIAHSGLGIVYEKQGSNDLAVRKFRAALSLDRKTALSHIAYARDRHEKSILREKAVLEAQVRELEELIRRYHRTTKLVDRSVSKASPN
jgi:Tfp pilus assembly protein PilF